MIKGLRGTGLFYLIMIKIIAFDADDTLWVNETYFRDAEDQFCALLQEYIAYDECQKRLYEMEMRNLSLYGYGIKPFGLSLIEAAIEITGGAVSIEIVQEIIEMAKDMLNAPIQLLDGIEDVLKELSQKYKLVVATKGDLLDQERKLEKSGLSSYFHHIEVMSDKQPQNYRKLIDHLDIEPLSFLMIGNSLKSDVVPVLEVGAHAYHIPFHTTWQHEVVSDTIEHTNFKTFECATDLLTIL